MSNKQSGRSINYEATLDGACYRSVKKELKNTITRKARAKFKRETSKAARDYR